MNTFTFKPQIGTRIDDACREACALAKQMHRAVRFRFNDVELTATRKRSAVSLTNEYNRRLDQAAARYARSPEGKRQKEKSRLELILRQAKIDELMQSLEHEIALGLGGVVGWLSRFAEVADYIDVRWDKEVVVRSLLSAGYVDGEYVGAPKEAFTAPEVMGRYIVGQAISCMQSGMPPHPITCDFAAKFFALSQ